MELNLDLSQMNPRQVEFFKANARHIAYGGARGGGKSWAMRMKFVLLALNYSNLKLLLLRRTMQELRENHILPLMALLNGVATYKADDKAFVFPNGSRLKLGYCDSENDAFQYQGQEYDVIGFEEATLFTWPMVQFILTCNRSIRSDFSPRAYYTMNPGGASHAEFKRLFIDRKFKNGEKPSDYLFIPARVYDNKVLMDNNPEYIRLLENLPEHLRKAHLDGDWNIFIGQVFSEFRTELHVVEPFEIPKSWTRYRSMDWGFSKPFSVHWYAIDYDDNIYVTNEYYGCNDDEADKGLQLTADVVAKECKERQNFDVAYGIADPAIWAKTGHTGPSIAETFALNDVAWIPGDNDRLQGKMQWHLRLKQNKIKIFSNCNHLIRTLPALCYDKNRPEDVDSKMEDHAYDDTRYFLMSRPIKPEEETKRKPPDYNYKETDADEPSWLAY